MYDLDYMRICLEEAKKAFEVEEIPVGALILREGVIISKAHNLTIKKNRLTAHAEILAIEAASRKLKNYRLSGSVLFVTKEPCIMCAGAIVEARIQRVVFGCFDRRKGALGSVFDVNKLPLNHKVEVVGGILEEECAELLKTFFARRRGTEVAITGPTRNRLYA